MITYKLSDSTAELAGILKLQKENLARNLSAAEIQSQGFVTVDHSYDQLKKLNDFEKHLIAKDNDAVVGYVLAMTQQSKFDLPVLVPMFELFENILYENKKISACNYLVIGQVCVSKAYRGMGIFDRSYAAYKKFYSHTYDFAITEIAASNTRSLNAHKRIGFKDIYRYTGPDNIEWVVVLWNWTNNI